MVPHIQLIDRWLWFIIWIPKKKKINKSGTQSNRWLWSKGLIIHLFCISDERRLLDEERPLNVQLNWGSDVREGRFLLKREVSISVLNWGSDVREGRFLLKREVSVLICVSIWLKSDLYVVLNVQLNFGSDVWETLSVHTRVYSLNQIEPCWLKIRGRFKDLQILIKDWCLWIIVCFQPYYENKLHNMYVHMHLCKYIVKEMKLNFLNF